MDHARLEWDKFRVDPPFEIRPNNVLLEYRPGLKLYYAGFPSDARDLDYERQIFDLVLAVGALRYEGTTDCFHIHQGMATVTDDHPGFDGLSGAPLFYLEGPEVGNTTALFAGMLIRASRNSKIMRFISGGFVAQYLLHFYTDGLSKQQADERFADLFFTYYPNWQR
jgi:hypothetical protein